MIEQSTLDDGATPAAMAKEGGERRVLLPILSLGPGNYLGSWETGDAKQAASSVSLFLSPV